MNIEKLVRCKIEGLQKMNKHYIAVEQSSVREEETNQSMLHRDSSITSVGDENLEPVEFELGKTIRGKECAWYNGFRYLRNAAHSLSWRCSDRKCKGTLRILERRDDKAFGHVGQHEHNHLPDPARKEADSKKLSLKRKIQEEPSAKPSKIFGQVRKDVNCEVFVEMGTDIALRHMMRRLDTINCLLNYETDIDLLQIITLLGLQIKGYLVGLHARRRESEFGEGSTIEQDE